MIGPNIGREILAAMLWLAALPIIIGAALLGLGAIFWTVAEVWGLIAYPFA